MVPLMLGERKIKRKRYFEALRLFLDMKESVGIIGAKPGSAMYFVGFQENRLLCLDPHYVQKCAKDDDNLLKHISTYQNPSLSTLPMSEAGSSMAVGFYFDSHSSFSSFQRTIASTYPVHEGLITVETEPVVTEEQSEEIEFVD